MESVDTDNLHDFGTNSAGNYEDYGGENSRRVRRMESRATKVSKMTGRSKNTLNNTINSNSNKVKKVEVDIQVNLD